MEPFRALSRRELLRLAGAAGSLLGAAWSLRSLAWPRALLPPAAPAAAAVPACVVRPQQTEGPFFVDARLNRSDIRSDPTTGAVKAGVPLEITFRVSRLQGAACAPLAGAIVDVWHCDALGAYSDVRGAGQPDTTGQKFLRGYQVTDAAGIARFSTIYPGWYAGRAVHVHFKIRTDPAAARGTEFTSQLYFDEAVTDQVHARPPYAQRRGRAPRNSDDFLFRNGGRELILPVTRRGAGYAGTFDIALRAG